MHTTVIQMIAGLSYGLLSFRTVNSLNKVLTEMERRNNCFIALFEAGPSIRLPCVLKWMRTMCGWGWDLVMMGIRENKSLCVWTAWSSALDLSYMNFFLPWYTQEKSERSLLGRLLYTTLTWSEKTFINLSVTGVLRLPLICMSLISKCVCK